MGAELRGLGLRPLSGNRAAPPLSGIKHPLMGARLSTLAPLLLQAGPLPRRNWGLATLLMASAAARSPLQPLEALAERRLRARAPELQAPLFIIGHWRSGTTHLHNVLGRSPAFGHISPIASGLPCEILTVGSWFRRALERELPEDRGVDRVAVTPTSPQEDEIPLASLQGLSLFHAVYFPHRFDALLRKGVFFEGVSENDIGRWKQAARSFAEKIAVQQGKPQLLIKNPVYTARIARLREIWPDAKFVFIHRNPYEVYVSTVSYYRRLLAELALQDFDHVDIEAFVTRTFLDLMAAYDAQKAALCDGELIEVAFGELQAEPERVLKAIHEQLSLPGWETSWPLMKAYLDSIAGYRQNHDPIPEAAMAHVEANWGDHIARWGYERPA